MISLYCNIFSKKAIILLMISLPIVSYSQKGVQGFFGVSQAIHTDQFMETNVELGLTLPRLSESLSFMIVYSYNGNLEMTNQGQVAPLYNMTSHFLGVGIKHRIFGNDAFYSPSVKLSFQTELATNYRGGYLNGSNDYRPLQKIVKQTDPNYHTAFFVDYYVSSPMILKLIIGNEFRIAKGLLLDFGFGFSNRTYKSRRVTWNDNDGVGIEDMPKMDLSLPYAFTNLKWGYHFEMSLGLNYTFPSKSKMTEGDGFN